VARAATNVNQLAHKANTTGQALPAEVTEAVAELRRLDGLRHLEERVKRRRQVHRLPLGLQGPYPHLAEPLADGPEPHGWQVEEFPDIGG
jgi:hypothetical protein